MNPAASNPASKRNGVSAPGQTRQNFVDAPAVMPGSELQPKILSTEPRTGEPGRPGKRRMISLLGTGVALALTLAGMYYYAFVQSYQSTDDAFIDGNIIDVAPKISGRIDQVLVDDNQEVTKGDLSATIDPRDYDAAVRQKEAALDNARAQALALEASIQQQEAHVITLQATEEADRATAESDRASAGNAATLFRRSRELFAQRVVAHQDLDTARTNAEATQATLDAALKKVAADQAQVKEAGYQVQTYMALLRSVQALILKADANLESTKLNRSYAEILAPGNGRTTNKSVQPGNYVQTGQVLLSLVPADIYITANFKENQIGHMRPGQPVTIWLDSLPTHKFSGHVGSLQAGSGARFSLLPPENATGNYVKVVQRVPVKILFNQKPDTALPLGPGESAIPTVKAQSFHYSIAQLFEIGAALVALLCLLNWRARRSPKTKVRLNGRR
jgi:membrane fusion protein (multidrug efflux system)